MDDPIQVQALTKSYANTHAVRGIDFSVQAGEVFALLGPNGAGKTTTVEVLEGLRPRSGGRVRVLGFDPEKQSRQLKDKIGVSLQSTNLPDKIRVIEVLHLFSSFYSKKLEADQLLQKLQLDQKRSAYFSDLSGGQKQRLVLALALINDPQVLFLDEPTAGLDPQARHEVHFLIEQLRRDKRTIFLTTHYIEEAEKLCDRVAILDAGRIIAMGTPREIQESTIGHAVIDVHFKRPLSDVPLPEWCASERISLSSDRQHLTVTSSYPARTLVEIVRWSDQDAIEIEDIDLKKPSLEDVFIELTGRTLRE